MLPSFLELLGEALTGLSKVEVSGIEKIVNDWRGIQPVVSSVRPNYS